MNIEKGVIRILEQARQVYSDPCCDSAILLGIFRDIAVKISRKSDITCILSELEREANR